MNIMLIKFLDLQKVTAAHAAEIHEAVGRIVDSGWYLLGNECRRFEADYAQYIGSRHCIGVANGLDALTLIYRAYIELGLMQEGDEVIVPANTYIASILAITENRLTPVLVEPDIETLEIDDRLIEQHITPRTRSIMIVHLYGRCAYTDRIGEICTQHGLLLVEDNAQAHGCRFGQQRTGSLGHAAGHSFYPGKNLGALGDAGAVTTDDDQLAECIRMLANYGAERKYVFRYQGRNSRLDEIQAAVLSAKLAWLDDDNAQRRNIAHYYYGHISNPLVRLPRQAPDDQHVYHLFPVFCKQRDELQAWLRQNGVETLIHYPIPPHRQACYSHWPSVSLPVTEQLHREELSLPMSPVLTLEEAEHVANLINQFEQ